MSEYLQEESRILPTHSEVREFAGKVDDLVNDVARAEARIEQLAKGP
jgi:ubiquinone biosynthesis protein UbiJ